MPVQPAFFASPSIRDGASPELAGTRNRAAGSIPVLQARAADFSEPADDPQGRCMRQPPHAALVVGVAAGKASAIEAKIHLFRDVGNHVSADHGMKPVMHGPHPALHTIRAGYAEHARHQPTAGPRPSGRSCIQAGGRGEIIRKMAFPSAPRAGHESRSRDFGRMHSPVHQAAAITPARQRVRGPGHPRQPGRYSQPNKSWMPS